jgi:glycerate kinase
MKKPIHVIVAPDSFKGSMSSIEIIETIKNTVETKFSNIYVEGVPIADGGEGTIEALIYKNAGTKIYKTIRDPLGRQVKAYYGVIGTKAIIEMAQCSGLTMLSQDERNPLITSSHGVGDMIKHALDDGFREMVIGLGGSGTNDGGTGAMEALGVKFYNKEGIELSSINGSLLKDIHRIDLSAMDQRLETCNVQVMCDVTNPLTGTQGATYVYGPQKGGDALCLNTLEEGMKNYEYRLEETFGKKIGSIPGSGAAGGMGAALVAFLQGELVRGIDAVLQLVNFDEKISQADLIITGEGRVDGQSAHGKVIHGITLAGKKQQVPVIVITGGVADGVDKIYDLGVKAILTLPNKPMTLESAMVNTKDLLQQVTYNLFQLLQLGQSIH